MTQVFLPEGWWWWWGGGVPDVVKFKEKQFIVDCQQLSHKQHKNVVFHYKCRNVGFKRSGIIKTIKYPLL